MATKKPVIQYGFAILFSLFFQVNTELQGQEGQNRTFSPGFLYVGEFVGNMNGGIETGTAYLGLIDVSLGINLEEAGLWKGSEFYIQLEHTHGATPTGDLVGDFQAFSNIENGTFTYLYELWYKHTLDKMSLQFGIIDLNADFLASDNGGLYANSSFGIMPTVSMNIPVPIFPKNTLGLVVGYDIVENVHIHTSIFDGDPSSLDEQANGLDFNVSKDEGVLSVTELHYSPGSVNTMYKLGLAYNSGSFVNIVDSTGKDGNMALYMIADQEIIKERLNGFLMIGMAPAKYNYNGLFIGAGLNLSPFKSREDDLCGLAFGYAGVSTKYYDVYSNNVRPYEVAIEGNYLFQLNGYLGIQPYFQYIINPGMNRELKNAFIGAVRLNVEL